MEVELRIWGKMYKDLYDHLFPGDGKESVAIALCGRLSSKSSIRLLIHTIIPIPTEDCFERTETVVRWSTKRLLPALELAAKKGMAILKIHSHPGAYPKFSQTDDNSDRELFSSVYGWMDDKQIHASAVMLPSGEIFSRAITSSLDFVPVNKISIIGDDIKYYFNKKEEIKVEEFAKRTAQAFGEGTTNLLKKLSVAVVGCSGTGSPVVEQLARLGFGKIVLVDPDIIEWKNLNRIINSKAKDASERRPKVEVLKEAVISMGLGTIVETYNQNAYDADVINAIAFCDIVFGCMDSVDGRHLLNHISTFYLLPYFDLGVKLIADGKGGIEQIWSSVHYIQPGKSSLMSRGVYDEEDLRAASLLRVDPQAYGQLKKEGYIKNVNVESPAVISVNMQVASLAVMELLARIHKFRYDDNAESAITRVSLTDGYIQKEAEGEADIYLSKFVGRGTITPLLNMPQLH